MNQEAKFLNSRQLFEARKRSSRVVGNFSQLRPPKKYVSPPEEEAELSKYKQTLDQVLSKKYDAAGRVRVKLQRDLGTAELCSGSAAVKLTSRKNKPDHMGFSKDGETYLSPEEALFLMENNSLQVVRGDLPLSLAEAFSVLLTSPRALERYRVYSHLTRIGFLVRKHVRSLENRSTSTICQSSDHMEEESSCSGNEELTPSTVDDQQLEDIVASSSKKLEKSMFLTQTALEESVAGIHQYLINTTATDWKNYKTLSKICNSTNFMESTDATLIQMDKEALRLCKERRLLPMSGLSTEELVPVVGPDDLMSCTELYRRLQQAGPRTYRHSTTDASTRLNIAYDCYHAGRAAHGSSPEFMVVVCSAFDKPPDLFEVMKLHQVRGNSELLFAVTDDADLNFYKITPFQCWDEIPESWKYLSK